MTIELNSKEAQEQMEARREMQEQHLEENYGHIRKMEQERAETFTNFAVLNWVLTLHDFSNKSGMDLLNAINGMVMVHLNRLEENTRKMEVALGPEKMEELGIDTTTLYPTLYCTKGLEEVQKAARARARAGKYIKLEKDDKRIIV